MVIKARVSHITKELKLGKDVQSALQEKLLSMTHRTCLWLYLVIEEVRTSLRRTLTGISDVIDSLTPTVEDAYEMLLSKGSKKPRVRRYTQILLHNVVAARRPLLLEELDVPFQIATGKAVSSYSELDLDREHFAVRIRTLCGLFIFINDMKVYLIHQTAKEFLVTKGDVAEAENRWMHSFKEDDSEMVMAKVCTDYLQFTDFHDLRAVDEGDFFDDEYARSHESAERDFVEYSACNWVSHLRKADTDASSHLLQTASILCNPESKYFRNWFSRYWDRIVKVRMHRHQRPWSVRGLNSFHIAAILDYERLVKLLLDTDRVGVDSKDDRSRTPLRLAVMLKHEATVKLLLQSGKVDANSRESELGWTPLFDAVVSGNEWIVKLLLDNGKVNPDTRASYDRTPLYWAVQFGLSAIVKLLLDTHGVSLDLKVEDNKTLLHFAALTGDQAIVKLLLNTHRVSLDSKDDDGKTQLDLAIKRGHVDVVKLFKSASDAE